MTEIEIKTFTRPPLTDSELLSLLRADGDEDNELPPCCQVISALRDSVVMVIRNPSWASAFLVRYEATLPYHEFPREEFPTLNKLVDWARAERDGR